MFIKLFACVFQEDAAKKARMERFGDVKSGLSPEEIAKYVKIMKMGVG